MKHEGKYVCLPEKYQKNHKSHYGRRVTKQHIILTDVGTFVHTLITRNKSIVPRRTMHTGRMSGHSTKKGVHYYLNNYNAYSRLFPANSASVCLRFAKSRPQFGESCGATYTRICEMYSALQSTSGPVTDVVNSVQIDV